MGMLKVERCLNIMIKDGLDLTAPYIWDLFNGTRELTDIERLDTLYFGKVYLDTKRRKNRDLGWTSPTIHHLRFIRHLINYYKHVNNGLVLSKRYLNWIERRLDSYVSVK